MEDEQSRLDFVIGQVHALRGVVLTLVRTHPDPVCLLAELKLMSLAATARTGPTGVSEDFLEGFDDLAETVRVAAARRVGPA